MNDHDKFVFNSYCADLTSSIVRFQFYIDDIDIDPFSPNSKTKTDYYKKLNKHLDIVLNLLKSSF